MIEDIIDFLEVESVRKKVVGFLPYGMRKRIKDKLGLEKVKFAATGSSVLSLDAFRLLHAIGIELRQVYASTEAGYISSHTKGEIKFESVGRPVAATELRLTNEGELLNAPSLFEEKSGG